MRKIYILLAGLITMMALVVAGCGSSDTKPAATSGVSADVKAIQDRGVLKVGVKVDVPKFGFKDPKTNEYGRADKAAAWTLLSRLYFLIELLTLFII